MCSSCFILECYGLFSEVKLTIRSFCFIYYCSKPENISHYRRLDITADKYEQKKTLFYINLKFNGCEASKDVQTESIRMNRKIEYFPNKLFLASLKFLNIRRC